MDKIEHLRDMTDVEDKIHEIVVAVNTLIDIQTIGIPGKMAGQQGRHTEPLNRTVCDHVYECFISDHHGEHEISMACRFCPKCGVNL